MKSTSCRQSDASSRDGSNSFALGTRTFLLAAVSHGCDPAVNVLLGRTNLPGSHGCGSAREALINSVLVYRIAKRGLKLLIRDL